MQSETYLRCVFPKKEKKSTRKYKTKINTKKTDNLDFNKIFIRSLQNSKLRFNFNIKIEIKTTLSKVSNSAKLG